MTSESGERVRLREVRSLLMTLVSCQEFMTKLSTCRIVFCTMVVMRRDSRVGCDVLRVNWGGGSAITLNS